MVSLVDSYTAPKKPSMYAHINMASPLPPSPPPPPPPPAPVFGRHLMASSPLTQPVPTPAPTPASAAAASASPTHSPSAGPARRSLVVGSLQQAAYELRIGTTEIFWNVSAAAEFVFTPYYLKLHRQSRPTASYLNQLAFTTGGPAFQVRWCNSKQSKPVLIAPGFSS